MKLIFVLILIALTICSLYYFYQGDRLMEIVNIRLKWHNEFDYERLSRVSLNDMLKPNRKNWFGLKWPNESDYK